jgi:nicotinate-nucleotide pyrophosphorylase (carboxylating)
MSGALTVDADTQRLVALALDEDHARNDLSTLWTIPEGAQAVALLLPRSYGVFCGCPLFAEAFHQLDPAIRIDLLASEGTRLDPDTPAARVRGSARAILSAERVALNLVGRFSGIATLTSRYVEAVKGTKTVILDTRKTMPLWRKWDKYAVRAGGGQNHRANLEEMVLLKDNHLSLAGGAAAALRAVKGCNRAGIEIEVEVDTLDQLEELLAEGVDRVLLDNMSLDQLRSAVTLARGRARLEASGGITLETIREVAETGVDYISVGALTHSPPAFDFSLEISPSDG